MRQKSVIVDEIAYIAAGYYHLQTGRFNLNMTNPPLMKIVSALPLLVLEPELPEIAGDPSAWDIIRQWQFSREFLYANTVDADDLLFAARLPVVGLGVLSWLRRTRARLRSVGRTRNRCWPGTG